MVPFWFTLSALCFVGAGVLLYVEVGRRRGLGRRRKSWARSHGFDYEEASSDIVERWKRGVMSTVGDVTARNVVLGQIRGEAVYVFDLEDVATVIALHRKVGTNIVIDMRLKGIPEPRENDVWLLGAIGPRMLYSNNLDAARRACDRRMVTFAHTAPDCAEILWNEQNWTLLAMPVSSTRAEWDEGLKTVGSSTICCGCCRRSRRRPAVGPQSPGIRSRSPAASFLPVSVTPRLCCVRNRRAPAPRHRTTRPDEVRVTG
jgi:hypothetical protein